MNFQFESMSDFWHMAGHGPYVWVCYLLTWLVIGWLVMSPQVKKRRFMASLARQQRLAERDNLQSSSTE